jgi:hypothetical protein
MGRQPLGTLSKFLLKPADIPEFIEDLPDGLTLAKKKNKKRWEQTKPNAIDEDQPNVKFASLKEQALFYVEIPNDDPIVYHDVDVGQGSPEELADAIEGLITSAEQAGMFRDGL